MKPELSRDEVLFQAAAQLTGAERAAFLNGACHGDTPLRQRLEARFTAADANPEFVATVFAEVKPTEEAEGSLIGRYKLVEKLGEGGFGVVWLAEQKEPVRRKVALKIIKLGMDTRQVVARFEAERQALAMMEHPNIAKVLDAGTTETGRPYFVMELVRGIKITDYCDQANLTTKERLDLFIKVCQAIQHAHQKGIIHRDIKPSNVMVTLHDGVPVPKVIDFGIAKATQQELTDKTIHTQFQQFIGTPAYMSPEQAEMSGLDIDTRSDIYSLGVLLYELLTGKTPFDAHELMSQGIDAMRRTIREKEPVRPSTKLATLDGEELTTTAKRRSADTSKLLHQLRGDLDWVVMKCLEKDRTRRYETANGLAADLKRHMNNEPVVARPPSKGYVFKKFVNRNRLAFGAGAAITVVMIMGLAISTLSYARERAARQRAVAAEQQQSQLRQEAQSAQAREEQQRRTAEAEEFKARQNLYAADMNLAEQAWEQQDIGFALKLLEAYRPASGERDLRGWEWRYLWRLCQSDELFTLGRHESTVASVAFSPDGRVLATASIDGMFKLWDPATRQAMGGGVHSTRRDSLRSLAFSPDGQLLATAGPTGVKLWDWRTNREVAALDLPGNVGSIAFSADGQMLAAASHGVLGSGGGYHSEVTVWGIPGAGKLAHQRISDAWNLAFSRTGTTLAVSASRGHILLWDITTPTNHADIAAYAEDTEALAFSPDGKTLASGGRESKRDASVKLWDISTQQLIRRCTTHTEAITSLAFSPDGTILASTSLDQTIKLWDTRSNREIATLRGHEKEIYSVAFAPDNQTLASGSKDGTVKLWRAAPKLEENNRRALPSDTQRWFLGAHGETLIIISTNATFRIWETSTLREIAIFPLPVTNLSSAAASSDGRLLATGGTDGSMRLWRIDGSRVIEIGTVPTHIGGVSTIGFSRDGRTLASAGESEVKLWNAEPFRQLGSFTTHPSSIRVLVLSPDGSTLATSHSDWTAEVWDCTSGKRLALFDGHKQGVPGLALSRHGDTLVTASDDATAKLWDVKGRREKATLEGQMFALKSAALSSDEQRLALGGSDRTIKIWDLTSKRPLATLKGHKGEGTGGEVDAVEFLADGNTLVSVSNGSVAVWRAATLAETDAKTK